MKKIKVLHIITRYISGGAETDIEYQLSSLANRYDITLATGSEYDLKRISSFSNATHIPYIIIKSMKHYNLLSSLIATIELADYIKRNNFTIVHTHTAEAGIIGRIAAKIAGVPIIIHSVQSVPFQGKNPLLKALIIICERIVSKFTDKYISIADSISKLYLEKKIGTVDLFETVYVPFDFSTYNKIQKKDLGSGSYKVCFASRIEMFKGISELLDAAENLQKENIKFFIAGEGRDLHGTKEIIRKKQLSNVEVLGYREDILNVIKACDVLVLPSYSEGTPRVIVEAFALKKPVIATNVGGIPEIVTDRVSGYLIEPRNSQQLIEKIRYLYNHSSVGKKMGLQGNKSISKFSLEENRRRINKIYRYLLKEKKYETY